MYRFYLMIYAEKHQTKALNVATIKYTGIHGQFKEIQMHPYPKLVLIKAGVTFFKSFLLL